MTIFLVLKCVVLIGFAISDSAVLTRPSDVSSCAGENVTIAWEYDNPADIFIALWTFDNGTLYDILKKTTTGTPVVQPSSPLNIEFFENGTIKLINTMSSYTGKYDLSLTYINASPDSDSVDIIINDVPQALVFQVNVTTFTCSGSSSIPTVIRVSTSVGNVRYEASPYTSSVTTEGIECCYNGSAASCSTETFNATYDGTIYCQPVRNALSLSNPDPKCKWCLITPWWWWCIILIVIGILIAICIVAAIVYCWYKGKCCFEEPRKCPCCPSKPPDGERIASASHVEMGDISSEKNIFVHKGLSGGRR